MRGHRYMLGYMGNRYSQRPDAVRRVVSIIMEQVLHLLQMAKFFARKLTALGVHSDVSAQGVQARSAGLSPCFPAELPVPFLVPLYVPL